MLLPDFFKPYPECFFPGFINCKTTAKEMKTKSLNPLSITFALGGVWDVIAGFMYIFAIGTGRAIDNPPIDPFYAIFLGSFFLCFAWLQILSSVNIRRYALNVGCLVFGRIFYISVLYYYMLFIKEFPPTFWFTGLIDAVLTVLYIVFSIKGGLKFTDLFLPETEPNKFQ
jgi:hypothetical protein